MAHRRGGGGRMTALEQANLFIERQRRRRVPDGVNADLLAALPLRHTRDVGTQCPPDARQEEHTARETALMFERYAEEAQTATIRFMARIAEGNLVRPMDEISKIRWDGSESSRATARRSSLTSSMVTSSSSSSSSSSPPPSSSRSLPSLTASSQATASAVSASDAPNRQPSHHRSMTDVQRLEANLRGDGLVVPNETLVPLRDLFEDFAMLRQGVANLEAESEVAELRLRGEYERIYQERIRDYHVLLSQRIEALRAGHNKRLFLVREQVERQIQVARNLYRNSAVVAVKRTRTDARKNYEGVQQREEARLVDLKHQINGKQEEISELRTKLRGLNARLAEADEELLGYKQAVDQAFDALEKGAKDKAETDAMQTALIEKNSNIARLTSTLNKYQRVLEEMAVRLRYAQADRSLTGGRRSSQDSYNSFDSDLTISTFDSSVHSGRSGRRRRRRRRRQSRGRVDGTVTSSSGCSGGDLDETILDSPRRRSDRSERRRRRQSEGSTRVGVSRVSSGQSVPATEAASSATSATSLSSVSPSASVGAGVGQDGLAGVSRRRQPPPD